MNVNDEQQDHLVRLLAPIHQVPHSVSRPDGPAAEELRRLITRTSVAEEPSPRRRARWSLRRRLASAVPAALALAAAAVVVSAVLPRSTPGGPTPAQALGFSQDDGYLVIRILDPVADPKRYKSELAQHGLDIDLSVAAAEPDQVGRVIFQEDDGSGGPQIKEIESPGHCSANGNCSVAIEVPLNYRGHAHIVFGRTPRPGEDPAAG